jgi:hypothetical protein
VDAILVVLIKKMDIIEIFIFCDCYLYSI